MSRPRIYIVEDEALIAMEIGDRLTQLGYDICGKAARGEAALEEIPLARPDLVLMDICLAGELNGIETAARLRRFLDVPVVFLSAFSDTERVESAIATEPFGYLVKPFEERELHAMLQAALSKHRVEQLLREDVRRQAELLQRTDELRTSEERYRYWMSTVPGAVYEFCIDAAGHRSMPFISERIVDLIGLSSADIMADVEVAFQRIPADAMPAMEQSIRASLESLSPWLHEFPIRTTTGEEKWLRGHSVPRREEDGATRWTGVLVDITERKRAEARLRTTQYAVDHATDYIFVIGNDGYFLDVNESACHRLGYTKQELLTKSMMDIDPDFSSVVWKTFWEEFKQKKLLRLETRHRSKSGEIYPVEVVANYILHEGKELDYAFVRDITERKRAEAALRGSEERLRLAMETAHMGAWDWNVEANTATYSHTLGPLFGLPPGAQHATVEEFMQAVHPEDRQRIGRAITLSLKTDAAFCEEYRIVWPDGTIHWVSDRGQVYRDQAGKPVRMVGVVVDITERKQTEIAMQFLSSGLGHLNGEAFFSEVADQVALVLGVEIGFVGKLLPTQTPRIRAIGLSIDGQAMPPVEYDLAKTPCERVIDKQTTIFPDNVQGLFPEDRMLVDLGASSYAAIPLFDTQGRPIGHVGIMGRRPLRQAQQVEALLKLFAVRTAAEMERQRTEAKFHDFFEFSPDAIVMVNPEGFIALANRQAEALFGYTREEFLGLPVETLMPESGRQGHVQLRRQFLASAVPRMMGPGRTELRALKKDGTIFPIDISLSPIQSEDGLLLVAAVRDVSDRKQAEAALLASQEQVRQMQKMEAIGTLAGGIAHDFNNILGAILGHAELALRKVAADHPTKRNLDRIREAGGRATQLVKQVLAFSRQHKLSRAVIPLSPVVDEVMQLLRATIPVGVELTATCAADTPNVSADATQVHQVLMNLGTNAWHALEGRPGRIELHLEPVMLAEPVIGPHATLQPGRYARLSVRDTGCGMDVATLERIFEPFFTTKPVGQGTGLGLSVVHGIMQGHGGAILVDSRPGQGTDVHLYFPASEAPAQAGATARAERVQLDGRGRHFLYVDDEDTLVELVRETFEPLGYRITGCTQVAAALDAVRADPGGFDLVVTDYNMPGLSGFDVARAVAGLRVDLPVVLVSGYLSEEARAEAAAAGIREIVNKPTLLEELEQVLQRLAAGPKQA